MKASDSPKANSSTIGLAHAEWSAHEVGERGAQILPSTIGPFPAFAFSPKPDFDGFEPPGNWYASPFPDFKSQARTSGRNRSGVTI